MIPLSASRPSAVDSNDEVLEPTLQPSLQPLRRAPRHPRKLIDLDSVRRALDRAATAFRAPRRDDPSFQKAAEWFLDNHHLLDKTVRRVRVDVPSAHRRRLLHLGPDSQPRVLRFARALCRSTALDFDEAGLVTAVEAYQQHSPLSIAELWALSTMIRIAVLEVVTDLLDGYFPSKFSAPSPWYRRSALPHEAFAPLHAYPPAGSRRESSRNPSSAPSALDAFPEPAIAMGRAVRTLRLMDAIDWRAFFERTSAVEEALLRDPAGVYARTDFDTSDAYRLAVEDSSWGSTASERDVAEIAVALAARDQTDPRLGHVGYYLVDAGRPELERQVRFRAGGRERLRRALLAHPTWAYLGAVLGLAMAGVLVTGVLAGSSLGGVATAALCLLTVVPAISISVALANWAVGKLIAPRTLPKLDFSKGIPADCKTAVVVPGQVMSEGELRSLLRQLELHYLSNPDPSLVFLLLIDHPDSSTEPNDDALLATAALELATLNHRYAPGAEGPFHVLHRDAVWNDAEGHFMGWERKRGKLEELNRLLRGDDTTTYRHHLGGEAGLGGVKFVITLDADTQLPIGAAHRLVGLMAHPLNHAQFDPASGRVTAGYTVVQPRVEPSPTARSSSWFSRVFTGDTAIDIYTRAVSDVYQDLFGSGVYVGKGIYELDGFVRSVGAVPENSLASHDLFEGIHGRVGLATDVLVFEEYPHNYLAFVRRLHRWYRGDWQLIPWLFSRRGPSGARAGLRVIDRWKIADNLRRSLLAPTQLALLVLGWVVAPAAAWAWAAAILSVPLVMALPSALSRHPSPALGRWAFGVAVLPFEAGLSMDAIGRVLVRLAITRRKLLQWVTAASTSRALGANTPRAAYFREMWRATGLVAALATLVAALQPTLLLPLSPLFLVWFVSPEIARWVSAEPKQRAALNDAQRLELRHLARRTWLFFETYVGPSDQWLPPDNVQFDPARRVAHRTSPTNLGLALIAQSTARDFGYIGSSEFAALARQSLGSMLRLERYRGHWLNWYDTKTGAPMLPKYVSTVDSGNLAASLIAFAAGCRDQLDAPILGEARWRGLDDPLALMEHALRPLLATHPDLAVALEATRSRVASAWRSPERAHTFVQVLTETELPEVERRLMDALEGDEENVDIVAYREARTWLERATHQLAGIRADLKSCLPWLHLGLEDELTGVSAEAAARLSARTLAGACDISIGSITAQMGQSPSAEASASLAAAKQAVEGARARSTSLTAELQSLAEQADAAWSAIDFGFLYDPERRLFRIGYNMTSDHLDEHHYDMLASEARITSFLAIVLRQAPQTHWAALARPMTRVRGSGSLLSWGGTMFEYMLPPIFMRSGGETLLARSEEGAVAAQIDYGRQTKTPFGISESGYADRDGQLNYQYRSFGVPALALARGLGSELVVAPYAGVLALPVDPVAVVDNLRLLEGMGGIGVFGLYEALDFRQQSVQVAGSDLVARAPDEEAPRDVQEDHPHRDYVIVRSHMAHHQGMVLAAISNALNAGVLVRRFHSNLLVKSGEPMLSERVPSIPSAELRKGVTQASPESAREPLPTYPSWSPQGEGPVAALLTNGRLTTRLTDAGAGAITWRGVEVISGGIDPTSDPSGQWIYLRDDASGEIGAATPAPTRGRREDDRVEFLPHKIVFHQRIDGVSVRAEVAVAPRDDVEIRQITLHNETAHPRTLTLMTYGVPVLEPHDAARRHPAFSRMFVECRALPGRRAVAWRRKKRPDEPTTVVVQGLVWESESIAWLGCELNREAVLGRLGDARSPQVWAASRAPEPDGSTGSIDASLSLALRVVLEPFGTVKLALVTAVASSRASALAASERFGSLHATEWAMRDAERAGARRLGGAGITPGLLPDAMRLVSHLLVPTGALRAPTRTLVEASPTQHQLFGHGISGDHPILAVHIEASAQLPLLDEALSVFRYLRSSSVPIELVFLDSSSSSYHGDEGNPVHRAIARAGVEAARGQRGGIFVLATDQLDPEDVRRVSAAARVYLCTTRGSLRDQIPRHPARTARIPPFIPSGAPVRGASARSEASRSGPEAPPLLFPNGYGGFTADGREYVVDLSAGQKTPAPWCNVLANPELGCLTSESALGCTWAGNSGENRLTPWRCDPVRDPPSEAIYLRDEESGDVWTPTPLPAGRGVPTRVRHGAGYTVYERDCHGLAQALTVFVPVSEPVKILRLTLRNHAPRPRRVTATYYVEWVLGAIREQQIDHIVTRFDSAEQCVFATCRWDGDFAERVAFVSADRPLHGLTCDRDEFVGRSQRLSDPEGLTRWGLSGATGPGSDPCAAVQLHIDLAAGEVQTFHFVLGQGRDAEHAVSLVQGFREAERVDAAWSALRAHWDTLLGAIQVSTPEPALDLMVNRWLLYQSLSSRLFARSGFYQSSGAFGFRDQLQDVMALSLVAPERARAHILEAASHQFEEGDVLHWWHPPVGRGVRTRCSDDLLWLPFVVAEYVAATGDVSILAEPVPFMTAEPLRPEEHDRYAEFAASNERGDLLEHCRRAMDRGFTKGPSGLPLIQDGDWNDGMNRVGSGGQGESVWLGWFVFATAQRFAALAESAGHVTYAQGLRARAADLKRDIERVAWDGEWYMRAFYDDGTPIGSAQSRTCRIDSIAQSWATLSKAGEPHRARLALASARTHLVREDDRLVLLLSPPFARARHDPGYIAAYPPGVRENGGQYTHAAVWLAWAHAEVGDGETAAQLLRLLNPILRATTAVDADRYRVEPYVLAADIYGVAPHIGRGGWTWYTGAASWTWRLAVEALLGLHPEAGGLRLDPCIPRTWPAFRATVRCGGASVTVEVLNPDRHCRGVCKMTIDGVDHPLPTLVVQPPPGTHLNVQLVLGG